MDDLLAILIIIDLVTHITQSLGDRLLPLPNAQAQRTKLVTLTRADYDEYLQYQESKQHSPSSMVLLLNRVIPLLAQHSLPSTALGYLTQVLLITFLVIETFSPLLLLVTLLQLP